jgi:hypothetical protein
MAPDLLWLRSKANVIFGQDIDLNGDGRPELITVRSNTGDIYDLVVYENKPTAPAITSFIPTSGLVGTVVTITGSRFGTTANLNTVSFNGGVPAQITNATATSLTVIVPDDATTGPITITANDQTSTSVMEFTVTRMEQSITFTMPSSIKIDQEPFNLTATASSGLDVAYTSSNPNVATVTDNIVTLVGNGVTTITASQAGNIYYAPAEAVSHTLTVEKLEQTILFNTLPQQKVGDKPLALTATASSGLPVAYTSSDDAVATISDNHINIIAAGKTTITALQPGNAWFAEALPVEQRLTVQKPDVITGTEPAFATNNLVVPNPVSTWAVISLKNIGRASAVSIRILDSNGRLVATRKFDYGEEYKLDMSAWTNGLYSIEVRSNTATYSARFAVMH